MADWKSHLNYDYTAYHAYAYGIIYQNGFEPNHSDAAAVANARGDPAGPAPAFYAARSAEAQEESPPLSPEGHARTGPGTGQYHYQGAEIDRLILEEQRRASVDERPQEARLTGSDTASDSDTYISPASWSSASSREGCHPQADCIGWVKAEQEETSSSRSPDTDPCGSPTEEPRSYVVLGEENDNVTAVSNMETNETPVKPATSGSKSKARTTFTDPQMNILSARFSVQRYLSPSEMRRLAEVTGLTYKQVKTWFQNRRMKLRREQKSAAWEAEHYTASGKDQVGGAPLNHPPLAAPHDYYRGEAHPQLKEPYSQHMMEAALKNPASQNLAFYLAAMAQNSGSASYPSWSSIPGIPQTWSMPQ